MADLKPFAGLSQETTQSSIANLLLRIWGAITDPPGFDAAQNRGRVTASIEAGTITTVTTVTTCGTVSAIDGFQGRLLAWGQDEAAWHDLVRSKIT